jgi:hypothetical protein
MPSNRFGPLTIKREVPVPCKLCHSVQQNNFRTEINIHFPGPKNLHKSSVWAFPTLLVCLNCGFTAFVLDRRELARLRDDSGTIPLMQREMANRLALSRLAIRPKWQQ